MSKAKKKYQSKKEIEKKLEQYFNKKNGKPKSDSKKN